MPDFDACFEGKISGIKIKADQNEDRLTTSKVIMETGLTTNHSGKHSFGHRPLQNGHLEGDVPKEACHMKRDAEIDSRFNPHKSFVYKVFNPLYSETISQIKKRGLKQF